MVYVGIDVHRKQSHLAALGEDGRVVLSRRVRTCPEEFLRVFGELEPEPLEVVFESTFGWGWLADLLADAGIPAHMAHPLATKAIAAGRVKNDAVDARTLAHLLRGNLLPEAWMAPPEAREARRLVRMRASLMRVSSRLSVRSMPSWPSTASHPRRVMPSVSKAEANSARWCCRRYRSIGWRLTCA
jgi:transposase